MSQDEPSESGMNRRSVLRSAAALGALPAAGTVVGAAPEETSVDVDAVVNHPDVQELLAAAPKVQLQEQRATVYGNESVVAVPANFGKLVVGLPSDGATTADELGASFYFDKWVPGVNDSWQTGQSAQLTTMDDGVSFRRQVGDGRKQEILQGLGRTEYDLAETRVAEDPDRGVVSLGYRNTEDRQITLLTAETGPTAQGSGMAVVEETTYDVDGSDGVSTQAECSDQLAVDILYCLWDYADCVFCFGIGYTGPVAIACWIIVCLDGGLSLALEYLTDFGCVTGASRIYDCLQDWVDQYGDQFL